MPDTPKAVTHDADRFRNLLAFFLISAFVSTLPLLIFKDIPTSNRDIITYMVGQMSGMATMALGFYFTNKAGQDAIDSKRAETTGKLAEAITATANSVAAPAEVASKAADEVADAASAKADQIKDDAA
jgi:hypothetical protein